MSSSASVHCNVSIVCVLYVNTYNTCLYLAKAGLLSTVVLYTDAYFALLKVNWRGKLWVHGKLRKKCFQTLNLKSVTNSDRGWDRCEVQTRPKSLRPMAFRYFPFPFYSPFNHQVIKPGRTQCYHPGPRPSFRCEAGMEPCFVLCTWTSRLFTVTVLKSMRKLRAG